MDAELLTTYRKWRGTLSADTPASHVLAYARTELEQRSMLARLGKWTFAAAGYGSFAHADFTDVPGPWTLRVGVDDGGEPTDWGDTEPTGDEREHASSFYVFVQVLDEGGRELYYDGIGGVDVIDLPGYVQRDWEEAAAHALIDYLYDGAMRFHANERSEATYWAARDVVTI